MATATKSRSTSKSVAAAAKRITVKSTPVKPAAKKATPAKPKPAAKPAAPKREQDSVTGTFQRGKRDKDGNIVSHEPKAGGGVRFEDTQDRGFSPVYLSQTDDALLGKPQQIRVTIKALA